MFWDEFDGNEAVKNVTTWRRPFLAGGTWSMESSSEILFCAFHIQGSYWTRVRSEEANDTELEAGKSWKLIDHGRNFLF